MSARAKNLLIGVVCFVAGALAVHTIADLRAQPAKPDATKPDEKKPKFVAGMVLKARKAAESDFSEAQKFGVEVFRDEVHGNLIYLTETGSIAVVPEQKK